VALSVQAEQEEEFVANRLIRRLISNQMEKAALKPRVEEEDILTNSLQRELKMAVQEKTNLGNQVEAEQECIVNRFSRFYDYPSDRGRPTAYVPAKSGNLSSIASAFPHLHPPPPPLYTSTSDVLPNYSPSSTTSTHGFLFPQANKSLELFRGSPPPTYNSNSPTTDTVGVFGAGPLSEHTRSASTPQPNIAQRLRSTRRSRTVEETDLQAECVVNSMTSAMEDLSKTMRASEITQINKSLDIVGTIEKFVFDWSVRSHDDGYGGRLKLSERHIDTSSLMSTSPIPTTTSISTTSSMPTSTTTTTPMPTTTSSSAVATPMYSKLDDPFVVDNRMKTTDTFVDNRMKTTDTFVDNRMKTTDTFVDNRMKTTDTFVDNRMKTTDTFVDNRMKTTDSDASSTKSLTGAHNVTVLGMSDVDFSGRQDFSRGDRPDVSSLVGMSKTKTLSSNSRTVDSELMSIPPSPSLSSASQPLRTTLEGSESESVSTGMNTLGITQGNNVRRRSLPPVEEFRAFTSQRSPFRSASLPKDNGCLHENRSKSLLTFGSDGKSRSQLDDLMEHGTVTLDKALLSFLKQVKCSLQREKENLLLASSNDTSAPTTPKRWVPTPPLVTVIAQRNCVSECSSTLPSSVGMCLPVVGTPRTNSPSTMLRPLSPRDSLLTTCDYSNAGGVTTVESLRSVSREASGSSRREVLYSMREELDVFAEVSDEEIDC